MNYKRTYLFRLSLISFSFIALFSCFGGDKKITAEQFMKNVRTPPREKTWAKLSGKAVNMKRDKERKRIITESPIYLGVRFTSERIFAQIVLGKDEIYSVGQPYSVSKSLVGIIKDGNKTKNSLKANFGIKPEDLTMSFLFWDLVKELPEESIKLVPCRVFLLKSPDKKETAKVYISTKSYFPVKVEWSKPNDKSDFNDIVRGLEIVSVKKVNDLYIVDELKFYGPGWRTNVEFNDCKAGLEKDGVPKDLWKNTEDVNKEN